MSDLPDTGSCGADRCMKCGRELTSDEIGLHRKLVNRGAQTFMCADCLCDYFPLDREKIPALIARFRAQGCVLFQ